MKLGNDIIEIDRIRQAIEKSSSFKARVYTIHEIEYCKSRNKGCYESFAGIYAAKEAFIKALGTGMRHGSWQDIETVSYTHLDVYKRQHSIHSNYSGWFERKSSA